MIIIKIMIIIIITNAHLLAH